MSILRIRESARGVLTAAREALKVAKQAHQDADAVANKVWLEFDWMRDRFRQGRNRSTWSERGIEPVPLPSEELLPIEAFVQPVATRRRAKPTGACAPN